MDVQVKNRKPQCEWLKLGVQGDNNVEVVRFFLPRYTSNKVDLYLGTPYVGFVLPDKSEHLVAITEEYKKATDDTLILTWVVGSEATEQPGRIAVAIKISGLESELWKSEKAYCTVADTIPMESPQREIYRSVRSTSNVVALPRIANPNVEPPITISERSFIIPQELQNIAVQNDQNSETVKIVCPRHFDGKDLSGYDFYLHTISTGGENPDIVFLGENKIIAQTEVTLIWTLRPPETSYAGKLTIQLKISGINFQWSTDSASVNIIRYQEGDPVVPVTPGFVDDFLKEITVIRNSAKDSETAAKTSQANAEQFATNAENSAEKSKKSADDAALSAVNAETSKGNADAAALAANVSETNAAESAVLAKDEVDKAKNEADRAKNEADRSKAEADRASGIVGGDYANKVKDAIAGHLVTLTAIGDIADSGKGLDDVGKVKSVFGRDGEIEAKDGDYTAAQITLNKIDHLDAGTVQEAVRILKKDGDEVREYFTPEGAAKNALFAANAQKLGGFLANEYNRALSFNPTIYVDAANGNDTTGDGSEAKPYATISKALYSLPKNLGGNTAIIKVADGTYDGFWITSYFNGSLQINADTPEKDRVKITSEIMCLRCICGISFNGLTSVSTANSCFNAQSSQEMLIVNCWATEPAPDTIGIQAAYGSRIMVNTVEISNKKIGANIDYAASLSSHMLTGSGNGIGVNCFSAIVYTSGSITGTTHRQVNYGQIFG